MYAIVTKYNNLGLKYSDCVFYSKEQAQDMINRLYDTGCEDQDVELRIRDLNTEDEYME